MLLVRLRFSARLIGDGIYSMLPKLLIRASEDLAQQTRSLLEEKESLQADLEAVHKQLLDVRIVSFATNTCARRWTGVAGRYRRRGRFQHRRGLYRSTG